ncbi:hypothetical protein GA0061098_10872 [Bradyrhizobium shewense]|uniref:Uncharacterized protein n=1 Tax=Bradyrhizobium shewense TaxID=1761772 RepID=A0A1C3XV71_9BRAD|nr:hypothetical protein [Bradyrhizobium shewense]SCB56141.1 hypothetical protein GA0061098_10872 [Bradyrhizobium shewense]
MSFTIVPPGRKPKPPIPLHRSMRNAFRDIERITAADELERAVELRVAEDRAAHQEKPAAIRERETDACLHR